MALAMQRSGDDCVGRHVGDVIYNRVKAERRE